MLALAAVLAAASSCESPPDGPQPLLGVHGTFEASDEAIAASQAALVFISPGRPALHIVDVDTEAAPPGGFDVRLWDPPPEDALAEFVGPDAEPNTIAVGYLAAVDADHPEYAPRITQTFESKQYRCKDDDPEDCFCPSEGCIQSQQSCIEAEGADSCYSQSWHCPELDSPREACEEFESKGDPNIAKQPWVSIRGVSQNYLVVYVKREATAWSFLAAGLGSHSALAAGYHLISVRSMSDEERSAAARCDAEAAEHAADAYNKKNGTSYDASYLASATCPLPGRCLQDEFQKYVIRAKHEDGCPLSDRILSVVIPRSGEALDVQLTQELWSPLSPN